MKMPYRFRRALVLGLTLSLCLRPAAAELPDLGDGAGGGLTPATERALGEEVMRDIRLREPTYVDDPELEDYLNALGARLAKASGGDAGDFSLFGLRDGSINAFALPGGFIGVHTGLLTAARSESELVGVLAHEAAHVRQRHIARMLQQQGNASMIVLASLVAAILASHSNSRLPEALIASGQAAAIQQQLGFSREHEREADRVGMQILTDAGFDPQGMAAFFERLQSRNRFNETNAPVYMRTHPMTGERIADTAARAAGLPSRKAVDSVEFLLLRAKYDAESGTPAEAVARISGWPVARAEERATRAYGLARAWLRERNFVEVGKALTVARASGVASPVLENLAAEIDLLQGRAAQAARTCQAARARFPQARALQYCESEAWLAAAMPQEALRAVGDRVLIGDQDWRVYGLQARAFAALGRVAMQHRAQAEVYVLQGSLPAAIDQLQLAQRSGDGDYYEQAIIDARLRELRERQRQEVRDRKRDSQ